MLKCNACARSAFIAKGHQVAHVAGNALPAHEKYQHLRTTALRMLKKGHLTSSEVDDWLEIPRGTTSHWQHNSSKPLPPKTETYRIQNPILALAFSGAWR
jgi:hypothetical protein